MATEASIAKGITTVSQLDKLAALIARPWLRPATVKKRIGDAILGKSAFGIETPKDPALHLHAVEAIYNAFGDDENWAHRVATSVYVQNCCDIEEIDRIVIEHAESRACTYPSELFRGQGWAPDRALWFLADQADYWRGYVCLSRDEWMSSESSLEQSDRFRSSGYELKGRRGCVDTIILKQGGPEPNLTILLNGFTNGAEKLIWNACGTGMPDALHGAIATRTAYDGTIGPADATFFFNGVDKQDWTVPPTVYFTLRLKWSQQSD